MPECVSKNVDLEGAIGLTTHVYSIGKEVAGVSDEKDETALDLGVSADMGELQKQARRDANAQTNEHTTKEDEQENAYSLEQADDGQLPGVGAWSVLLRGLE